MLKKITLIIAVIVAAMFFGAVALADDAYYFERFDVTVDVNENYTFDVEENIVVNFTEERHGIYRYLDNKWGDDCIKYSNIRVQGALSQVSRSGDYTSIRIGDADSYVYGEQYYTISYTIALPPDDNEQIDAVYMNIMGFDHPVSTLAGDFVINMPKRVDPTYLEVLSGYYDYSGIDEKVDYEYVNRNQLNITITEALDRYEGITVKMDLPQGYFENVRDPYFIENLLKFCIPIGFVLIGLLIWAFRGIDKRVIMPVEIELNDLSPAEAGYIIDGVLDGDDIASMLIYWASKGYLRIEEIRKNSYRFYKLVDEIDAPDYEQDLFDKLLEDKDDKGYVTTSKVKSRLVTGGKNFKSELKDKYEEDKTRLLNKKSVSASKFVKVLSFLSLYATVFMFTYREDLMLAFMLGMFLITPIIFIDAFVTNILTKSRKKRGTKIFVKAFAAINIIVLIFGILELSTDGRIVLLQVLVAIYCSLILLVISYYTQQMTEYGHEMYERVLGFRHYMMTAEKDWIVRLANDDPEYFYSKLPYALVLGVSRVWIGKFADSVIAPPSWYTSSTGDMFVTRTFSSGLMSNMQKMGTSYETSSRSTSSGYRSSSSSFSSGGGFSGGGFSGGGSSSW